MPPLAEGFRDRFKSAIARVDLNFRLRNDELEEPAPTSEPTECGSEAVAFLELKVKGGDKSVSTLAGDL